MVSNEDAVKLGLGVAGGYVVYNTFFGMSQGEALEEIDKKATKAADKGEERTQKSLDDTTTEEELEQEIQEVRKEVNDKGGTTQDRSIQDIKNLVETETDLKTAKRIKLLQLNAKNLRLELQEISDIAKSANVERTAWKRFWTLASVGVAALLILSGLGIGAAGLAMLASGGISGAGLGALTLGIGNVITGIIGAKGNENEQNLTEEEKAILEMFDRRKVIYDALTVSGGYQTQPDVPRIVTGTSFGEGLVTTGAAAYTVGDFSPNTGGIEPLAIVDHFIGLQYDQTAMFNLSDILRPLGAVDANTGDKIEVGKDWAMNNIGLASMLPYAYMTEVVDFRDVRTGTAMVQTIMKQFESRDGRNIAYTYDPDIGKEVANNTLDLLNL